MLTQVSEPRSRGQCSAYFWWRRSGFGSGKLARIRDNKLHTSKEIPWYTPSVGGGPPIPSPLAKSSMESSMLEDGSTGHGVGTNGGEWGRLDGT